MQLDFTKLRHKTKQYTKDNFEYIIDPLCMVINPKINIFVQTYIDDIPANSCAE